MKIRPRLRLRHWLVVLFTASLISVLCLGQVARSTDPAQLVQQGIAQYEARNFKDAIATWKTALAAYDKDPINRAIVLENIARAYQQSNQSSEAIRTWNQLIVSYQQDRKISKLSKALVEQAQLYSSIGQPKQAIALLCAPKNNQCTPGSAVQLAKQVQDNTTVAAALGSLGDAYRLSGDYNSAIDQLSQALELAQNNPAYKLSALNGLANAYMSRSKLSFRRAESAKTRIQEPGSGGEAARLTQNAKDDEKQAIQKLEESLNLAQAQKNYQAQLRSLLTLVSIYSQNNSQLVTPTLQQAIALLDQLPENRVRVYAMIDLARLAEPDKREKLLENAIVLAQKLQDNRAESIAYGELGALYETQFQIEKALAFTRKAVLLADQKQGAKDSLYRWEWQTGRLLANDPNQLREAIAAYERAVQTLEEIRSDILNATTDLQFDFRKSVEPVYRQLITLRLKAANTLQSQVKQQPNPSKENITLVLTAMDSLRLAELQNYFGNECVLAAINRLPSNITTEENKTAAIQTILTNSTQDQRTAVLNHILLPDQLILVLNLPNNEQHTISVNVTKAEMEAKIINFRKQLERYYDPADFDLTLSQDLYQKLIQPVRSFLPTGINTLVFVQDGLLRSIPMAALYDGKQYLVEKYAIATTPSLSLIDLTPFDRSQLRALALGVTKAVRIEETQQNFRLLRYAEQELQDILTELPGSKRFELLKTDLKTRIREQPYPIIHITTHGQFGADPKDTFLVTGDGKRLTIEDFDQLLRDRTNPNDPIELLMLTACQTGTGDDRSALGLAGVAIQAGVKSALASLWFINDKTTANLTREFYRNLKRSDLTKAQAVQEAQKSLIGQSVHPGFWSAFILVGNWR